MPFGDFGMFVGADLGVSTHGVPSDLAEFARYQRDNGRIASWRDDDFDALTRLVDLAGDVSDAAAAESLARSVLVHSDFNAKNLLVDLETSQVCGVLDWEFAHAGSPYADLGNLTRFDREPTLVESTVATLVAARPEARRRPAPGGPCRRPVGTARARRTGGAEPGLRAGDAAAPSPGAQRRSPRVAVADPSR